MHLLISAIGSTGDVYPALGLGTTAVQRGHRVSMITSGNFERAVCDAGLEYVELVDARTYEGMRDSFERQMAAGRSIWAPVEESGAFDLPEHLYEAVARSYMPGETVLATMEMFTLGGGGIAREVLHVPYASLWHNPPLFRTIQPHLPVRLRGLELAASSRIALLLPMMKRLKPRLDALRERAGLPPKNFMRMLYHSQDAGICLFPRWYAPWYANKFPDTVFSDFPRYEHVLGRGLSPELEAFVNRGDRPVVVSTASWRADRAAYFQTAVDVCRSLGRRVILQGADSLQIAEGADDVFAADLLPYTSLLPRTAAFVHHGGIGSIASGLAAGVPQLVVSMGSDTPRNARKVKNLGVGFGIANRRYGARFRDSLQRLLASDAIASRAREIAGRFSPVPDLVPAIDALEALHARRTDAA